ncbi:MAG TPA: glycosyltransferase family 2 protein [Rhodospirillales bacterium]|nr:glycosyltransferase family 2 protein [Rhodospirillales bacterium]
MTKLIIQIPCFNEEQTLAIALADLPTHIDGIDQIERLIINDGSTDDTLKIARQYGVEHIVDLPRNQGLARGFMAGLQAALAAGADIIVNTDADNQYNAADIEKLVAPVRGGQADIVVGARPIGDIEHFSRLKKWLQKLGSWVVRSTSGTDIMDAPSGFRAISREAALRLNVFNEYTYTLETIIQAGQKGMTIVSVPIRVNADLRPSRLVKSVRSYVIRSLLTIFRIFMVYRPLRFFLWLGTLPMALGLVLGLRWLILYLYFPEPGRTHVPSLILAAILTLAGFQLWMFGFLADLVAVNRLLLEDLQYRARKDSLGKPPAGPS